MTGARDRIIAKPVWRWALMSAAFLAVGLFRGSMALLYDLTPGGSSSLAQTFYSELLYWGVWLLFSPLVLGFARRFHLEKSSIARGLALHIPVSIGVALVHVLVSRFIQFAWIFGWGVESTFGRLVGNFNLRLIASGVMYDFYNYWIIAGVYYAIRFFRQFHERRMRTARLQAELFNAELSALKMQFQPHFLFNSLNSIASVAREHGDDRILKMLVTLSELMRRAVERPESPLAPLGEEIALISSYLEMQRIRFENRLSVNIDIDDATLNCPVPHFILQPLVENALEHGVDRKESPGAVTINSRRRGGAVVLSVCDDGPGPPRGWNMEQHARVGLSNVINRLDYLYDGAASLTFSRTDDAGSCFTLTIPCDAEAEKR